MRVLVTGASSGIGAATAATLREQGADVVELDVRPKPGAIACDLGNRHDLRRLAESIGAPLDAIAHVAGLPGTFAPDRVLAVNFLGPRLLTRLLLPRMGAGASIVFVSSIAAHRCAWPDDDLRDLIARGEASWEDALAILTARETSGAEAYDLSKRLLAFALPDFVADAAPFGVRVNLVSPGPVETPILADFRETMGADRLDAAARVTGRHARPGEIARAVAFLLTSEQSSWIDGIDLVVDGGLTARRRAAERRTTA